MLHPDKQAVLTAGALALALALAEGVPTKTHVLNLRHRLVDGHRVCGPPLDTLHDLAPRPQSCVVTAPSSQMVRPKCRYVRRASLRVIALALSAFQGLAFPRGGIFAAALPGRSRHGICGCQRRHRREAGDLLIGGVLVKKPGQQRRLADVSGRKRGSPYPKAFLVDRDAELMADARLGAAMFAGAPFPFALDPGAVDEQMQRPLRSRPELCLILGDGPDQSALVLAGWFLAICSVTVMPSRTRGT